MDTHNIVCEMLGKFIGHGHTIAKRNYPVEEEDWELGQGDNEYIEGQWKMIANYDSHLMIFRYYDKGDTNRVFEWKITDASEFVDRLRAKMMHYNID